MVIISKVTRKEECTNMTKHEISKVPLIHFIMLIYLVNMQIIYPNVIILCNYSKSKFCTQTFLPFRLISILNSNEGNMNKKRNREQGNIILGLIL